jgi:hypothetical protein
MGTVGGFPRSALGAIRAQPPSHGKRQTESPPNRTHRLRATLRSRGACPAEMHARHRNINRFFKSKLKFDQFNHIPIQLPAGAWRDPCPARRGFPRYDGAFRASLI